MYLSQSTSCQDGLISLTLNSFEKPLDIFLFNIIIINVGIEYLLKI